MWGHVTIKMSGQPPFGAQIILNGHEYVGLPSPGGGDSIHQGRQLLHRGRQPRGPGSDRRCVVAGCGCWRLSQVCRTWIYSACLCFALDLDQQLRSRFVYGFAVYQLEYSRNLIFADGASDAADRPRRGGPDPIPPRRAQAAHHLRHRAASSPHPTTFPGYRGRDQDTYRRDLTVFKLHFGRLIGKAYTTGERVLRFAAIAHNTAELRCGRMIEKFPEIVTRLAGVVERFASALDCVDTGFRADGVLDQLPPRPGSAPPASARRPQQTPDANALRAALALAPAPNGFTVGNFAAKVHAKTGTSEYTIRRAAYDLRKLRDK